LRETDIHNNERGGDEERLTDIPINDRETER